MIELVSATRLTEAAFWQGSALGLSLRRLGADARLSARIAFANTRGLPEVYNAALDRASPHDRMVFVHDDIWLDDYFLVDRVVAGLEAFEVIGVAGNRRRVARQPGWAFVDERFSWDDRAQLSGAVAHGRHPFGAVSVYGDTPAACELLDGAFLAVRRSALDRAGVRFDARFDFHFYDMDLCRSARAAGLRLGTWPICVTHQSGGAFGSAAWTARYRDYLAKWGE